MIGVDTAFIILVVSLLLPAVGSFKVFTELVFGALAMGIAAAIPLILWRWRRKAVIAWLAIYVFAYSVLSSRGSYIGANHGGNDNRDTWYPAYCGESYSSPSGRQNASLRPLGWFFLPLLIVDRLIVHRTIYE